MNSFWFLFKKNWPGKTDLFDLFIPKFAQKEDSKFNIFFIKQQQLQYKNGIITSTINKIGYNGIT